MVGAYNLYSGKGSIFIYDYSSVQLSGGVGDLYGRALAVGDFDGDGDNDLAIGNPAKNSNAGEVLIFLKDISSKEKGGAFSADVTITGSASSDFGFSLAAGELSTTVDKKDDLLIGAPGLSTNDGGVYLFNGRTDWSLISSYTNNDLSFTGVSGGADRFGYSLIVSDDLSATPDGRPDFVVGAPLTPNGTAYIYYGDGSYPTTAESADVTLNGSTSGENYGSAFALGYFNSDYRQDLAIGSPLYSTGAGRVSIIYNDGSYSASADVTINGEPSSKLGTSLIAGDFDDDGDHDLALGAPEKLTNQGAVYILYNDGSYPSAVTSADVTISGAASLYFGQSVAMGDFDDDGDDDLTAAAEGSNYFYFNDGSYPSDCCNPGSYDLAFNDSNSSYNYNSNPRQTIIADLTQDGKNDVLVSSPGFSNGSGNAVFYAGANNQCEAPNLTSLIIVDTNGFTNSVTPNINLAYLGGGSLPIDATFSCDGGINWSDWKTVTGLNTPVTVDAFDITSATAGCTSSQGNKTILAKLRNACGYKMGTVATASTYYDTVGPTVSTFSTSITGTTEMTLTATAITDGTGSADPYQYQFSGVGCTGNLAEQAWTADGDATDVFTGLSPNTAYAFKVKARDELENEGSYTACSADIYTSASVPGAPIVSSVVATSLSLDPVSGGAEKEMAIYAELGANCDGSAGLGYVQADGTIGQNALWKTDAAWSTVAITSLNQGTQYSFCSKARNQDEVETSFSSATVITTNATPVFKSGYPSDGGSVSGTPTNVGSSVTFSAAVTDANSDSYWLLVCKNGSAPTVGSPPECSGGSINRWARSALTSADVIASVNYTALVGDAESNIWYAFVCDQYSCSASSQASGNNGSPFAVNHQPDFGIVSVGDTTGGTGTIEPGDTIYFNIAGSEITDADTNPSQDTINMYVCDGNTTSFDYSTNTCISGSLICSDLNVDFTAGNAECNDSANSQAPIPTAHGSKNYNIYLEDNHSFAATGTNAQVYTVQDVPPTFISYVSSDVPNPIAGGSDTVTFSARLQDDNGEADVISVEGFLFDDDAVNLTAGECTPNDQNCYQNTDCTLNLAYGDASQLEAQCDMTLWFNANPSSNWELQANPTDELGKVTSFSSSNINIVNPSLSGVGIVGNIAYGNINPNSISKEKSITLQNLGNTVVDIGISGSDLVSEDGSSVIDKSQQEWSSTNGFTYGTGNRLVETPETIGSATGCYDANMSVRTSNDIGTGSDTKLYWLFKAPSLIPDGSYTGTNIISTLTCD